MKDVLCRNLQRVGLYQRVKASWLYDAYWLVMNSEILTDRRRECHFYASLLEGFQPNDLIFDIGANQGYKADIFLRLGARVICVEPDEASDLVLRQAFLQYRVVTKRIKIVSKAVADKTSVERMWIDTPGSAKNTLNRKWVDILREQDERFGNTLTFNSWKDVEATTIDRLIAEYGRPFFIKIDIEGNEVAALRGMTESVPYLSYEVNLPEFRAEGLEGTEILEHLADGHFNYTADCRNGLALQPWVSGDAIRRVIRSCHDRCIEIFWRSGARALAS